MAAETHHLEQLLHRVAEAPFTGEHARELDAGVLIERIVAELRGEVLVGGAARASLRDRRARENSRRASGMFPAEKAASAARRVSSPAEGTSCPKNSCTCGSGIAPMNCATARPSLNAMTFGIERILKACDSSGFSSELTFTSLTRPPNDSATLSRVGPSARHGPHQGAQKSTTTGTVFEASTTSRSKVAVVTSMARHCTAPSVPAVAAGVRFWQASEMALRNKPRVFLALGALGALGVAAIGGAALWLTRGGESALEQTEAPLIGYAPSAPAAGSMQRYETEYPTIPYTTGKRTDRVAALIDRIERGEAKLERDGERGYLTSLLAALEIDPSSQMLVYSQTSLQSRLIGPKTPRAIYFNDDVYVGYVQGAPIEIASLDPSLGPVF